jgi:Thioredoxin domain-containing protein
MVKFYQSWCGHCMRMKPDWDRLAQEAPSDVFIADVHCEDQQDVSKKCITIFKVFYCCNTIMKQESRNVFFSFVCNSHHAFSFTSHIHC